MDPIKIFKITFQNFDGRANKLRSPEELLVISWLPAPIELFLELIESRKW
ncbi:MAG: hypothetical protein WAX80_00870 [Minisyncoccia bacterium]